MIKAELFNLCFLHLLDIEGGYVDDPADRGGKTKYGISARQYPHKDIANLTIGDAKAIYLCDYWLAQKCDQLPDAAAALFFDSVVNHSPATAAKILQKAIGTKADGIIGKRTLYAARQIDPVFLSQTFLAHRACYYTKLVTASRDQERFILGWHRRLFSLQQFVLTHVLRSSHEP